ncbi:MAG: 8-oxoguanine DNA glycosylase [Clostridia bacterium]|nr:8-oxoguanine DNA glycosylase [Clostridia bacterium]
MTEKVYDGTFFNIQDTLECGQIFRFRPFKEGYLVISGDKACYAFNDGKGIVVISEDGEYFDNFFDMGVNYGEIVDFALESRFDILKTAAAKGSGVRILRQQKEEMLFSFIVSQNNHIPRIKKCIETMCEKLGEEKVFMGEKYYSFPKAAKIAEAGERFFAENGFGYRASYMDKCANELLSGFDLEELDKLPTAEMKKRLLTLYGIGPKVADCISLFGYHRTDSFPVDTWIEKIYREDFKGELTDRNKITSYFTELFREKSGYMQQYLFYYKRSLEK